MFLRQNDSVHPDHPGAGDPSGDSENPSSEPGRRDHASLGESTTIGLGPSYKAAALCGILAGPILIGTTLVATLVQPADFSFIHDPSSDLGAATANHPWISNQLGSVSGLLLLVFAIALGRAPGPYRPARFGAFVIGVAAISLLLTGVFTPDCRTIDTDCARMDNPSWHAIAHLIIALITFLILISAPFVVARAVKSSAAWHDLRTRCLALGVITIVASVAAAAIGPGLGDYVLAILWFGWITMLSVRMLQLAGTADDRPRAVSTGFPA